jgi:hypothetical protein
MKKEETKVAEKEVKENVMVRIKTFEDAMKETGRPEVPNFLDLPEDLRDYFKAQYKMIVVVEAINEGWKANWEDNNEPKYYPYFYMSSGVFVFCVAPYRCSNALAGFGSRLCFKTRELARYAGEQFLDIWTAIIQK